jgi:PITH domain
LNCIDADNGFKIFKPWDQRLDTTILLSSEEDYEMIIYIPFVSCCKLTSIGLLGVGSDSDPSILKVFVNRDDVDFDSVEDILPTQQFECSRNSGGVVPEYKTAPTKFGNVRSLTLFISSNFGAERTVLSYIGLKGEFTVLKQDPVITNYEVITGFIVLDCCKSS